MRREHLLLGLGLFAADSRVLDRCRLHQSSLSIGILVILLHGDVDCRRCREDLRLNVFLSKEGVVRAGESWLLQAGLELG